jgi:hypothetical protein
VRFVLLTLGGGDPYKRVQRRIREQWVVFRLVNRPGA